MMQVGGEHGWRWTPQTRRYCSVTLQAPISTPSLSTKNERWEGRTRAQYPSSQSRWALIAALDRPAIFDSDLWAEGTKQNGQLLRLTVCLIPAMVGVFCR